MRRNRLRRIRLLDLRRPASRAGDLPAARPTASTDTDRLGRRPGPRSRGRMAARSRESGASATRESATIRTRDQLRAGLARHRAARRRPPRCSNRPRSTIRRTREVLGAYGRALADTGNYKQALDVLSRAHTPEQPDWRMLSVQGAVLDQMGRHADAQRYYASALKIMPDEPSVLSNLGLSYALSKDLAQGRGDAAAGRRAGRRRPPRAAEPRAGGRPAGPFPGGRGRSPAAISRPTKRPPMSAYLRQMLAEQNRREARSAARTRPSPPAAVMASASRPRAVSRTTAAPSRGWRPGRE